MSAKRIDFLDLARGWVIFLVVWVHTDCPFWVTANFVNAFFFFLGGFFFKKVPWKDFMTKQVKGLLIPFLFFYLLSYPFRIVLHFWDYRTLAGFDWGCIFDLFDCADRSDYLFVNVPLWFILCIFVMRVYYWFLCTWPRKLLWGIALALLAAGPFFQSIPSPFMMNNACYWLGFFMLGNLCGKTLIQYLSVKQHRFPFFAVTGLAGLACYALEPVVSDFEGLLYVLTHVERLLLLVATLAFFSFGIVIKYYPLPFRFFGENSLAVLGYHIPILIPFARLAFKMTGMHEGWIGGICALLTMGILYYLIRFSNRYIPRLVGKA